MNDLASRIAFLIETEKLKSVLRRNKPAHLDRNENSAEHSWSLAIMAMLFADLADEPLHMEKVLELVAVHDLVEVHAGDTFCYDATANIGKAEREQCAADLLFNSLPGDHARRFRGLWNEFEAAATAEARFANAIDRLLPLFQHRAHKGAVWQSHAVTKQQVLNRIAPVAASSAALHDCGCQLVEEAVLAGWLAET
jgi:putative hydrolase of HD superfamily